MNIYIPRNTPNTNSFEHFLTYALDRQMFVNQSFKETQKNDEH